MKEIQTKDLKAGLLKKRTKAQLFQMICHVANVANEYTPNGIGLVGDRALAKLNLVRDRFKIRVKPVPAPPQPPAWVPGIGEEVRVIKGSTYYAPGKTGMVVAYKDDGYEVCLRFQDLFVGETSPTDHVIWAGEVAPLEKPTNPS